MRLKLLRMGKSICKGPLVDTVLIHPPWQIGEARTVDDEVAHQLLAKYPGMFQDQKSKDLPFAKMRASKIEKPYKDKIQRPKGVK